MGTSSRIDDLLMAYLESIGITFNSDERTPIASYESNGIQYEVYDRDESFISSFNKENE